MEIYTDHQFSSHYTIQCVHKCHVYVHVQNPLTYSFANVTDLSPTSYTINYYNHDATNDTFCNSSTILATHCENECSFVFNVSSSTCPQTANIKITAYATNILGRGPQSEPIVIGKRLIFVHYHCPAPSACVYSCMQNLPMFI